MLKTTTAVPEHGSADRDRGVGGFVRRHGLVSFYALAYGLSWLAWLPFILSRSGLGVLDFSFPAVLGVTSIVGALPGAYLGPLGAAFIVTAVSEGRPGLRRWTGRLFKWGVNWRWYALVLVGVPALLVAAILVVSPGSAAGLRLPSPLLLLVFFGPALLLQIVTTGLAEEPGWRDFALVRHQRQQGPLLGTLILGVLWAGWHLPLFWTEWGMGMGGAHPLALFQFVVFCIMLSIVITWVFNKTKGSLPLVVLLHVSNNNFWSVMFAAVFVGVNPFDPVLNWVGIVAYAVPSLALVMATRGRLGYRPDEEPIDDGPVTHAGGTVKVA